MDEDKNKKPLLSYEQVIEIIDKFLSRDETDNGRDERIVRVEKVAEELEADYRKKVLRNKKKKGCSLKWFCRKLFGCTKK